MLGLAAPRPAPVDGDLAVHTERVEPGPSPLRRACWGLLAGAALGALAALVTPRPSRDPLGRP